MPGTRNSSWSQLLAQPWPRPWESYHRKHHSLVVLNILTPSQDNILVDGDGGARIAGLGTAHVPFSVPIGDIIPSSHGALAPELVGTWRWGLTDSRPTTASDVFALSLVIWEVRMNAMVSSHESLNGRTRFRSSMGSLPSPIGVLLQGCIQF